MISHEPKSLALFNEQGRASIQKIALLSHYLLLIFTDNKDDEMAILPVLHGEATALEQPGLLKRYYVHSKQARRFLRLFRAHQTAIDAGLYQPEAPARYVRLKATKPFPLPKDIPLSSHPECREFGQRRTMRRRLCAR